VCIDHAQTRLHESAAAAISPPFLSRLCERVLPCYCLFVHREREKDLKDDDDGEGMRAMNTCQQHQRVTGLYRITKCTSNTEYTDGLMKTRKKEKGMRTDRHHQIEYYLLSRTYCIRYQSAVRDDDCIAQRIIIGHELQRICCLSVCLVGCQRERE